MNTALFTTVLAISTLHSAASDLNDIVVKSANAYPNKGGYNAAFKGSGTPEAIFFKNAQILSKAEDGTYCSGFTFAVAMRSMTNTQPIESKTVADVRRFQQNWYGATESSKEKQCVMAAETLGVGKGVSADEAHPGDFVQFWRKTSSESGHSAVFLGWAMKAGKRVGLEYRSSQGSTGGIGNATEYFDGQGGKVIADRMYFCRLATK